MNSVKHKNIKHSDGDSMLSWGEERRGAKGSLGDTHF